MQELYRLFTLIIAVGVAAPAQAAWEGKEITKDGQLHIMNPSAPSEGSQTIKPPKLWEIGGDDSEEYLFGVLTQITTDESGNIYLLDAQLNEVYVFSPSGEYLRSIGREGEGPGEFRRPSDIFMTADGNVAVMQRMPGKIVVLTPEGEPVGDHPVPRPENDGMQMFAGGRSAGDQVVVVAQTFSRRGDNSGFEFKTELMAVDASGSKKATYYTDNTARDFAKMEFDEKEMGRNALVWATDASGRVFTSDDYDRYRIKCWNADGSVDRVIERSFEHRVRSNEERERFKPRIMMRRSGGRTMQPDVISAPTDRDVQDMFPREDGTLWVLSSAGGFDQPEGRIATFDVFDPNGRFTRQVTLEGKGNYREDGFTIVGNRLYVVTGLTSARQAMMGGRDDGGAGEEDVGPMAVVCYDLTPAVQTKK